MGLRPSVRPSSDKINRMASSPLTITAGFTGIVGRCEHKEPRAEGRGKSICLKVKKTDTRELVMAVLVLEATVAMNFGLLSVK